MRICISWLCPFNLTKGLARLVECWSAEQDVVGLIPRPNQYSGFFNSWSYLLFPIKYLDRTFSWLGEPCRNGSLMSSRRHKKVGCPQTPEKLRPWDVSKTRTFNYRRHFPDSFFYQMVITVWKLTRKNLRIILSSFGMLLTLGVQRSAIIPFPLLVTTSFNVRNISFENRLLLIKKTLL